MTHEKMTRELQCYHYCMDTAFDLVESKEYVKAAGYYENAARSLREVDKLKGSPESIAEILTMIDRSKLNRNTGASVLCINHGEGLS